MGVSWSERDIRDFDAWENEIDDGIGVTFTRHDSKGLGAFIGFLVIVGTAVWVLAGVGLYTLITR